MLKDELHSKPTLFRKLRRPWRLALGGALALFGALTATDAAKAAPPAAAAPARPACTVAAMQALVTGTTTVSSARALTTPNTGTAYCRVDGSIRTTGPGGDNTLNWQVSLPDRFAGRYLFIGIGGTAGV